MKIRWTRSSVRLRITPTELDALASGTAVEETFAAFPGGGWAAKIEPDPNEPTALTMEENVLRLRLSGADRDRLAAPDAEGVYFEQSGVLYQIEKDFPCLHPRAAEAREPQTETFTPPTGFAERKGVG